MTDEGRFIDPAEVLKSRRRKITTSVGDVLIRPLSYVETISAFGSLVDVASIEVVDETGKPDPDKVKALVESGKAKMVLEGMERIIRAAVIKPRIGTDPENGMVVSDLPMEDQTAIFNAVLDLSKITPEAARAVRP